MRRRRITSATSAAFPMPLAEPPTMASSMAERVMPSAGFRMSYVAMDSDGMSTHAEGAR